jgi:hypothetical protein
MSAGYDAEVADLFRDLRAASNLTEADLAARIATPVEVVQALEQGAIYALPPWPETCRVVSAYGTLLNLDTRPLLRRIYAQLEAGVVELGPKPVQDVPVMVPPAAADSSAPTVSQAGQLTPELVNGTPQPQAAPQAPGQPPAQQVSPEPTPQMPQQAPAWPESPLAAPLAGQPEAAHPQAVQPQALQPQPVPSQPLHPQPLEPQPIQAQPLQPQLSVAPPDGALHPQSAPPAQGAPQPQAVPHAPWPGTTQPGQLGVQPQQTAAAQADEGFPGEPQPYPQQPGYAPDPSAPADPTVSGAHAQPSDASFPGEPELELVEEEVETEKSKKSPLLKWGIFGLLAVVLLLGLWMVFTSTSDDVGLSSGFNTSDPVLDPDDPRSRKSDRLPNNF